MNDLGAKKGLVLLRKPHWLDDSEGKEAEEGYEESVGLLVGRQALSLVCSFIHSVEGRI